jgi:hypothetical protein
LLDLALKLGPMVLVGFLVNEGISRRILEVAAI